MEGRTFENGVFMGHALVGLEELKEHENISSERLEELHEQIVSSGQLDKPIVVDMNSKTIIDGHHRYHVFKRLGLDKIPVIFVDYFHESIVVQSARNVTKRLVVHRASIGKKFGPKTTRHMLLTGSGMVHISDPVENINYPVMVMQQVK